MKNTAKGVLAAFLIAVMAMSVACASAGAAQGQDGAKSGTASTAAAVTDKQVDTAGKIASLPAAGGESAAAEKSVIDPDLLKKAEAQAAKATAEQGTVRYDAENLLGLDNHASAHVQIANNGSLPPYSGSATKQAVKKGADVAAQENAADYARTTGAKDAKSSKGDTHSSVDQYIDLTSSCNILTAINSDHCDNYSTTAYRIINTGNADIHCFVQEDVKGLDDYYWNGKEWRDSFYEDRYTWSVSPGSYVEFTLPVNAHQGIFHNKVRGTYVQMYAVQTPQGPDHVKVTDGNIVTEFNIDNSALDLYYDDESIRCVMLPMQYVPTFANLLDAMQANGYIPPNYMRETDEPEDLPVMYVFEWFPQHDKFEVEITKN
jgi:hypothetical protein